MKDQIINILRANSGWADLNGQAVYENKWEQVAEQILSQVIGIKSQEDKKQAEKDFLAMYNRIKENFISKAGRKFVPARTIAKPSQLHSRLKDYTMDEIGRVALGAFKDDYHAQSMWKYVTTEYVTRTQTIEKYLL